MLPGLWRLRLPLPSPAVPHCNAWAIAAGSRVVLVDTGAHAPDSMEELERAMAQVGLQLEQVELLACTHAHNDHWGQAAPICELAGCELWMHPDHAHATHNAGDPELAIEQGIELGRRHGFSEQKLRRLAQLARDSASWVARMIEPDRELVAGVQIETDLGPWTVYETPGHAPSHVCLFQREHRLLISGDHVLGRISLYYDHGFSPDPVGEFTASLDVVDELGARLAMSGHGKPFADVHRHIEGTRELVAERLGGVLAALDGRPRTAVAIMPNVFGSEPADAAMPWRLRETLCYLTHLEARGLIAAEPDGVLTRWRRAGGESPDLARPREP